MKRKGNNKYVGPGQKLCTCDEELSIISDALIMWRTISLMNGDPEKKSDMEAAISNFCSKHTSASPKWLWENLKRKKSAFIVLLKEERIELRRVQWTTYKNLKDWFLAFKKFVVEYGFATLVQYSMYSFLFFYLSIESVTFNLFRFFLSLKAMKERRFVSQLLRNGGS